MSDSESESNGEELDEYDELKSEKLFVIHDSFWNRPSIGIVDSSAALDVVAKRTHQKHKDHWMKAVADCKLEVIYSEQKARRYIQGTNEEGRFFYWSGNCPDDQLDLLFSWVSEEENKTPEQISKWFAIAYPVYKAVETSVCNMYKLKYSMPAPSDNSMDDLFKLPMAPKNYEEREGLIVTKPATVP